MSVPCDLLMHPELLTNEQLILVIHERHLRLPNMEHMTREKLLDVFHNFCVPFGQRKARECRGKSTNRNVMEVDSAQQSCLPHKAHYSERLKPPPDILSSHIKRIKISVDVESKSLNKEEDNSLKRKITHSVSSQDHIAAKKQRKPITWP